MIFSSHYFTFHSGSGTASCSELSELLVLIWMVNDDGVLAYGTYYMRIRDGFSAG